MKRNFVVDANLVIKWFCELDEDLVTEAREIAQQVTEGKLYVWAPFFLLIEVSNILLRKKHLSKDTVLAILKDLKDAGIQFVDVDRNEMSRVVQIADLYNLSVYDALYLFVAKEKKCSLLTLDKQLLKVKDVCISLDEFVAN